MADLTLDNSKLDAMGLRVADHVTAMLAYWDNTEICRFANNAYRDWFGKSKEDMIDKISMKELLGPLYEKNLPYIKGALAGKKQVFEREIPLFTGGSKFSLATYFPDIINGKVKGFYVHVADITHTKELEASLLQSRREMLRNVIEIQEQEKSNIAFTLSDNINQKLVYCKMVLQLQSKKNINEEINKELLQSITNVIEELNTLSVSLSPTAIAHFGFIAGVEDYINNFKPCHHIKINFECKDKNIEELGMNDKLSAFRIIQNVLILYAGNPLSEPLTILVVYCSSQLVLSFIHYNGKKMLLQKESNEFKDIERRVEYYNGTIKELLADNEKGVQIILNI